MHHPFTCLHLYYISCTTITGELSLLMLIEAYELAGIHVISANTDGVTVMVTKDLVDKMHELNKWWMEITQYELERTDYQKIIFSTVNDYLAIKTDGEIKKKGDFLTDFELHKNKSARIVPIALELYYVHDIPVADTIRNHTNIYDYCLRQKASKDFHYEGHSKENKTIYNKLIRYYVSNTGEKLLKVKNKDSDSGAADVIQVEAGEWSYHNFQNSLIELQFYLLVLLYIVSYMYCFSYSYPTVFKCCRHVKSYYSFIFLFFNVQLKPYHVVCVC